MMMMMMMMMAKVVIIRLWSFKIDTVTCVLIVEMTSSSFKFEYGACDAFAKEEENTTLTLPLWPSIHLWCTPCPFPPLRCYFVHPVGSRTGDL